MQKKKINETAWKTPSFHKELVFGLDRKTAKKVFDTLIQQLESKEPPYDRAEVPQQPEFIPSNIKMGSRDHALWFFVACLWMRGGIDSNSAVLALKEIRENEPHLFTPEYFQVEGEGFDRVVKEVHGALMKHKLSQRASENSIAWAFNMRKLALHWNGNPVNLMLDQPDFPTLYRRIAGKRSGTKIHEMGPNGFMYFQEKMVSMIVYFLMDAGLVPLWYFPVPVDFHVLRLLVSNQIIRVAHLNRPKKWFTPKEAVGVNFYNPTVLSLARQVTEDYCRDNGVSPVALCDTLWLLSRTFCRGNPTNASRVFDPYKLSRPKAMTDQLLLMEESPNGDEFIEKKPDSESLEPKGRKRYLGITYTEKELGVPNLFARIKTTCGQCPVEKFCKHRIPSGAYYIAGVLVSEGIRPMLPENSQVEMFKIEDRAETYKTLLYATPIRVPKEQVVFCSRR